MYASEVCFRQFCKTAYSKRREEGRIYEGLGQIGAKDTTLLNKLDCILNRLGHPQLHHGNRKPSPT